mgnify:CR=1 FL=1
MYLQQSTIVTYRYILFINVPRFKHPTSSIPHSAYATIMLQPYYLPLETSGPQHFFLHTSKQLTKNLVKYNLELSMNSTLWMIRQLQSFFLVVGQIIYLHGLQCRDSLLNLCHNHNTYSEHVLAANECCLNEWLFISNYLLEKIILSICQLENRFAFHSST